MFKKSLIFKLVLMTCLMMRITTILANDHSDSGCGHHTTPKKRQIYREQVLPHAGGRIPDAAFETDRLFLNRLQKEGIAVPDGIVLEQRNPQVQPYYSKQSRAVLHVALSSDERFVPREGLYHNNAIPSVETTYLYPQIHGHHDTLTPNGAAFPVYRDFHLHNPQLNQLKFQAKKKKGQNINVTSNKNNENGVKVFKSTSYQNFNILNEPLSTVEKPHFLNESPSFSLASLARPLDLTTNPYAYKTHNPPVPEINEFKDFNNIFDNFNLHEMGAVEFYKSNTNKFNGIELLPMEHFFY